MRQRLHTAGIGIVALALAACTANPPPPVESAPTTTTTTPVAPVETGDQVVVAIDDVGIGFNPHLMSDQSPANSAVSALVLPSPFRPTLDPADPARTVWTPDPSLLISAEVTSQNPFTVRYQLRNEAQWSDSAPIAAEDFRYLWRQMISQPGVVDPAGYALIDDVQSSGGGKTVDVTMRQPYPNWQRLFTDLVPSHLLKDSPGGFQTGLSENVPVSGGRFNIKSIDQGRDEILLERNDRFWDEPALPDQILLRRGGTAAQLADSLRSKDAQVAQVRASSATRAQLAAIPGVRTDIRFQPRVLDLTLNGRVPALAEPDVRRGLLGLLDSSLLSTVAAGSGSADHPARAQLSSPSDPGYAPTAPAPLGRDAALELLNRAGYVPLPDGTIGKGGVPLDFVIGAVEDDGTALAVANTAADQLAGVGIAATVTPLPAEELYGTALTDGEVDAIVGWTSVGLDAATVMASRFGCAAAQEIPASDDTPAAPPSNTSGLCVPELTASVDRALAGELPIDELKAEAEPALWGLSAVLPISQDSSVVAVGNGVEGVSLEGPIEVGIFGDAATWMRTRIK
ncbi:ABC transporter family substrate-binding protein [Rhodococcoides kyotonense]|uniref:ABC-type transport system, substrate-binding protein n=1 Tax=Rhodococcoides kyotonense TaxID=398843 RepID=A0A239I776_9NOCA|nr:ABC transporter family substrate-binding protein [Rhodococcus kyotonensis]SNS89397.1 ABC-type transport system, substrate-binding protein [Rhodococcus kyotonensis]